MGRTLEGLTHIVEPVADAGVRLPGLRQNVGQLALLDVEHADAVDLRPAILLVVYGAVFAVLCNGRIVEMGHGFQAEGIVSIAGVAHAQLGKRQAAVGVEQIRLIFVDEFLHDGQPVFAELLVLGVPLVQIQGSFVVDVLRSVVMIEIAVGRIVAVIRHTGIGTVAVVVLVHIPPGERRAEVLREAEGQAMLVRRLLPQAADILVRAHLNGIEAVQRGIIVEEMVVMHGLADKIARTGLYIEIHEGFRIKLFGLPQCAEILVAKLGRVAVMTQMIEVLRRALDVHVAGIPVAVHGNRLRAPVGPDAEFSVAEPVRALVLTQGIKACLKFFRHFPLHSFCFGEVMGAGSPLHFEISKTFRFQSAKNLRVEQRDQTGNYLKAA